MSDGTAFLRLGPALPATPLVVSVPHAGRDYPAELLTGARVARDRLELLEDRLADRLVTPLAARGTTIFVATRARAWLDLNRAVDELDPAMVSPVPAAPAAASRRMRSGLGLIPRRIAGAGEIYARPLALEMVAARIAQAHAPWHAAIAAALAAARDRFGYAVLIDCHSMPPLGGADAPAVVIGDRYGSSAGGEFVAAARTAVARSGVRGALNVPYAGGYTLERHGRPAGSIHALQVEFSRGLYLDATGREAGAGLPATQRLLDAIARAVIAAGQRGLIAAE